MIILAPTGLYDTILPGPLDSGNITYTISNSSPPRSSETFVQLPLSEEIRKSPQRLFNKQESRKYSGKLIFDISVPGPSTDGHGDMQYETGEILEFGNENGSTDPYTPDRVELRQDTKIVDFERAGLSEADYIKLHEASAEMINVLTNNINIVSTKIKSNASDIESNQSDINNANNILKNIEVVLGQDSEAAEKVRQKLLDYNLEKEQLLNRRSDLLSELDTLKDKLMKVRETVR